MTSKLFDFFTYRHDVAHFERVGRNIHHVAVYADVAVRHQLAGSGARRSDAQTIYHIVQTAFEQLQQVLTRDTAHTGSLLVRTGELFLQKTVRSLRLLLLAELLAVLRYFFLRLRARPCCPGGKFRFSRTLSAPKIASPNFLAILDLGPIYLPIVLTF